MTLAEWCRYIENALSKEGIENSLQEAKWLIAGALKGDASMIILKPEYVPSPQEERILQEWTARRLTGEPLSRLKGIREFWSLPFQLNAHTLDPRPDTETLIEGILQWIGKRTDEPWRILDLGTGSGCLLITLLHELKGATGVGVDLEERALEMARLNALTNKVEARALFYQGNWGAELSGSFDIIVSNPPYIPLKDKSTLDKNVSEFDPALALFGGDDGLECYRFLRGDIKRLLSPHGIAVLEIGGGMREGVEALFQASGFSTLFILKDLENRERAIGFTSNFPLL